MENVCIPLQLDAYCMTEHSCDGPAKIAPITQPNYTSLRLDSNYIQHDLLNHIDFHRCEPASLNSRLTDLGAQPPALRLNRLGVYLHWAVPYLYRNASTSADTVSSSSTNPNPNPNPAFRRVPNRYLLIRRIKDHKPPEAKIAPLKAWVIESDRLRNINDLDDSVDLETDVSPFISYGGDPNAPDSLRNQTEVFIGRRFDLETQSWTEGGQGTGNVPLTVFNSSNPLFADYVIHNSNVFSTIDDFQYKDQNGNIARLTMASCDYTILGWHTEDIDPNQDPFGKGGAMGDLQSRLSTLHCTSNGIDSHTLGLTDPMRTLVFGSIYGVQWDRNPDPSSPKIINPANEASTNFSPAINMEPLSLGTTPLDAILTFIAAHNSDSDTVSGKVSSDLASRILSLGELLYASEDSYGGRVKAQDLLLNANYTPTDGGSSWHYDGKTNSPGGASKTPSQTPDPVSGKSELDYLADLNEYQSQLDVANRQLATIKWALFAQWFNFVTDPGNNNPTIMGNYNTTVQGLVNIATKLSGSNFDNKGGLIGSLTAQIASIKPPQPPPDASGNIPPTPPSKVPCKQAARPTFFTRMDPTLCIAGMDAGYPSNYLDKVMVRLGSQLAVSQNVLGADSYATTILPPILQESGKRILSEAFSYVVPTPAPTTSASTATASTTTTSTTAASTNTASTTTAAVDPIGFKNWNGRQPFNPIFLEWTAFYFHIPFTKYATSLLSSPVGNNHSQVRYGIPAPALHDDPNATNDMRSISGRCLILPQPSYSLSATLASLFNATAPSLLPLGLQTQAQQQALLNDVQSIKFISAPLDGLTDHLLTRYQGSHVKPNVRPLGGSNVVPLDAATRTLAGFSTQVLKLIDAESSATPYGNLFDFSQAPAAPFKPVTHGQMMLTGVNVVDKFGQAVCVPQPTRVKRLGGLPEAVLPCLADNLCPSQITINGATEMNTVIKNTAGLDASGYPLCPLIQLTPAINQEARINAEFMVLDDNNWRVATDWDNPIWAWVVVNYADSGLQFFLDDGTFYVELRFGGPLSTATGPKWLPFDPPQNTKVPQQLTDLIARLTQPGNQGQAYLMHFWKTIEVAIKNMPFPPSDYAQYANAIVGKPLALTNTGWSLELAVPPLSPTYTLGPPNGTPMDNLLLYNFPFKLGDMDRPFDGVVAYWDCDNVASGTTNWDTMYSYKDPNDASTDTFDGGDRRFPYIDPTNFDTLTPYYLDPLAPLPAPSKTFTAAHEAKMKIKTVLVDPYTPLHGYSPILPNKFIQLPPWTIQAAQRKMAAFFIVGPMLVTKNPQAVYDSSPAAALTADSWIPSSTTAVTTTTAAPLKLPIKGKGLWRWLQPFWIQSPVTPANNSGAAPPAGAVQPATTQWETRYNALQIGEEDGNLRRDQGPYTMLEGFLQLTRPVIKEDVAM